MGKPAKNRSLTLAFLSFIYGVSHSTWRITFFISFTSVSLSNATPTEQCSSAAWTATDYKLYTTPGTTTRIIAWFRTNGENLRVHPGVMFPSQLQFWRSGPVQCTGLNQFDLAHDQTSLKTFTMAQSHFNECDWSPVLAGVSSFFLIQYERGLRKTYRLVIELSAWPDLNYQKNK